MAWAGLAWLWAVPVASGPGAERTQQVKAAFVLNIARFVEWPAQAFDGHEASLLLCLYRDNPLGDALESIRGKRVAGRTLDYRMVQASADGACNVLFVPGGQLAAYRADAAAALHTLTISDRTDLPAGGRRGGIQMTLVRDDRRIGIEIDMAALRRSGLRVSSELLKLGRIVDGDP